MFATNKSILSFGRGEAKGELEKRFAVQNGLLRLVLSDMHSCNINPQTIANNKNPQKKLVLEPNSLKYEKVEANLLIVSVKSEMELILGRVLAPWSLPPNR